MRSVLARLGTSVVVVIGLAWVVPRGSPVATSDPEPPSVPPPALEPHPMFTPYAADEGAVTFEEMSPEEQAVVVAERERESAEVREARFARLKSMTIARGERTHAEAQASMIGLDGAEADGVIP